MKFFLCLFFWAVTCLAQVTAEAKFVKQDYLISPFAKSFQSIASVLAHDENVLIVAISNDTTLDFHKEVLIYVKKNEKWQFMQKLSAPNEDEKGSFCSSFDVDGDTIAVGAYLEGSGDLKNVNGKVVYEAGRLSNRGAVYLYQRKGELWELEADLKMPSSEKTDLLGYDLDLDGNTLVVGAQNQAFVYEREDQKWVLKTQLRVPEQEFVENFGIQVALDQKTILVSAEVKEKSNGVKKNPQGNFEKDVETKNSIVYVFIKGVKGWQLQDRIPLNQDSFGPEVALHAAALHNDTIVVGSIHDENVYVFERSNQSWSLKGTLKIPEHSSNDNFTTSLAIHNNTIVMGSPFSGEEKVYKDPLTHEKYSYDYDYLTGRVFIFQRKTTGWQLEKTLKGQLPQGREVVYFGFPVSFDGKTLFVQDSSFVGDPNERQSRGGTSIYSVK